MATERKIAYNREWKKENPDKVQAQKKRYNERKRNWFNEVKNRLFCKSCGENRIPCLDFHHPNPKEKEYNVSKMIIRYGKERILKEIKKCDVLCSNCHRIWHYENQT